MPSYSQEKIRFPANAGHFYPEEKEELERMIKSFLKKANPPKIEGKIFGLLVPHAGYVFSGQVAAYAYKTVEEREFEKIILIGDSHYERFDGVSLWEKGKWETPLGEVKVSEELAKKTLQFSKRFFIRDSAHLFEHSLEVQIPFLQVIFPNFEILPIIFGSEDEDWKELASFLSQVVETEKTLILVSSDLSHYPPYEVAKKVDLLTINSILSCAPEVFQKKIKELEREYPEIDTFACAQDSIKTILQIAKNLGAKATLLCYQNSGDSPFGDHFRVVGYGAIAFHL